MANNKRPSETTPRAMSVSALAGTLGISKVAVYNSLKRGEIPHLRLGKRILISKDVVDRLLGS